MTDWIDCWKDAGDAADAVAALADDAELISPITDQFGFRGTDEIELLLRSVFDVVDGVHYTGELRGDGTAVLMAATTVSGVTMQETQLLRLGSDGKINSVTMMIRPLPALTRLARHLGPALARRQGRLRSARTLTLAAGVLDSLATTGDRKFIPLTRPDGSA